MTSVEVKKCLKFIYQYACIKHANLHTCTAAHLLKVPLHNNKIGLCTLSVQTK